MNFICKKCLYEYSSMKCPSEYSSVKGTEIIFLSADMIALICMWYSTYIVPVIVLHNSLPSSYDNFISHNVMNTDFYKNNYELSAFVFWGCKNLIFIHNVMNLSLLCNKMSVNLLAHIVGLFILFWVFQNKVGGKKVYPVRNKF